MEKSLILVETAAGLLVFEDSDFNTYSFKSVEEAVEYYRGNIPPRVGSFFKRWKGISILVERRSAADSLASMGLKPVIEEPLKKAVELRSNISMLLEMLGLSPEDYKNFMVMVAKRLAQTMVEESARKRDLDIVMAMQTYDDLVKMLNMLQDRIMIWVKEREPSLLEEHRDTERIIRKIMLDDSKQEFIRKMAELYMKMLDSKNVVEEHISMLMSETAPNLSSVAGPLLGARLISKVGSLSRLASLPASTIQIIGAEKALFRAMRKKGRPPKHGIIFQHPWVHGSPRKTRGKIARLLASRIAVATRVDCFSGRLVGEDLKKDLENRVKALMEVRKTD